MTAIMLLDLDKPITFQHRMLATSLNLKDSLSVYAYYDRNKNGDSVRLREKVILFQNIFNGIQKIHVDIHGILDNINYWRASQDNGALIKLIGFVDTTEIFQLAKYKNAILLDSVPNNYNLKD